MSSSQWSQALQESYKSQSISNATQEACSTFKSELPCLSKGQENLVKQQPKKPAGTMKCYFQRNNVKYFHLTPFISSLAVVIRLSFALSSFVVVVVFHNIHLTYLFPLAFSLDVREKNEKLPGGIFPAKLTLFRALISLCMRYASTNHGGGWNARNLISCRWIACLDKNMDKNMDKDLTIQKFLSSETK